MDQCGLSWIGSLVAIFPLPTGSGYRIQIRILIQIWIRDLDLGSGSKSGIRIPPDPLQMSGRKDISSPPASTPHQNQASTGLELSRRLFGELQRMESLTPQSHIGIIGIEPNRTESNRTDLVRFWPPGLCFRIPHQILCPTHQTGAQTDSSLVFWCQIIKINGNQSKSMEIHENLENQ